MTANTPRSRKSKGRKHQNYVRDILRSKFQYLHEDDITSRQMGGAGSDIILSPAARDHIPFEIECKCQETLNIWAAMRQAKQNTPTGRKPLVVFTRNREGDVYAMIRFEDLLELL